MKQNGDLCTLSLTTLTLSDSTTLLPEKCRDQLVERSYDGLFSA